MKYVALVRTVRIPEYKPSYNLFLFKEMTFGCVIKILCTISNNLLENFVYKTNTHSVILVKCIELKTFISNFHKYLTNNKNIKKLFLTFDILLEKLISNEEELTILSKISEIDLINEVDYTEIKISSAEKVIELEIKNKYSIDENKNTILKVKQDKIIKVAFGLGGGYAKSDIQFKEIIKFKTFNEMYKYFIKRRI